MAEIVYDPFVGVKHLFMFFYRFPPLFVLQFVSDILRFYEIVTQRLKDSV